MNSSLSSLALFLLVSLLARGADVIYHDPVPAGGNPAAFAAPRDDWYKGVQDKFTRFQNGHYAIVFDGDSITNRWETTGRAVWDQHFKTNTADFGIEGDRVENLLWRLSKGQVDGLNPKVVVIMIGTNNSGRDSADQIAEGIRAVVAEYEKRCPDAHIILMAVFPRGAKPDDAGRKKNEAVNAQIAALEDGKRVSYVDIGPKFLQPDGTISTATMPDFVHPTAPNYQIWADAILPIIRQYIPDQP